MDTNPTPDNCAQCGREIHETFYLAKDRPICNGCHTEVMNHVTGGSPMTRFLRALVFGLLGAGAGAALYFIILATTGYEIGLVAILVGFIVGKAVHAGSRARGGAGYQTLAVALTYGAIVVTYIPFILMAAEEEWALEETAGGQVAITAQISDGSAELAAAELPNMEAVEYEIEPIGFGGVIMGIGGFFVIAAAAPVLMGLENIIGLAIIGFALHQAWSMNRRNTQDFKGPFQVNTEPSLQPVE